MKFLLIGALVIVPWTVRPYGPDEWAVVKDYGPVPEWSVRPGEPSRRSSEVIACRGVPDEGLAYKIANALNEGGPR